MADMAASMRTQQQTRIKALTFPREHGAWGLLLIPLVTGACIGVPYGHGPGNLILFITAALSIFWLRTPLESYFGMGLMRIGNAEERKAVLRTIAMVAPVMALSVGALLWNSHDTSLLTWAALVQRRSLFSLRCVCLDVSFEWSRRRSARLG